MKLDPVSRIVYPNCGSNVWGVYLYIAAVLFNISELIVFHLYHDEASHFLDSEDWFTRENTSVGPSAIQQSELNDKLSGISTC